MAFDDTPLLNGIEDYLNTSFSAVSPTLNVYQLRTLDPADKTVIYNLEPPFIGFNDGTADNELLDEEHIVYDMQFVAVTNILDEGAGGTVGRDPVSTWRGVNYYVKLLTQYLVYPDIAEPNNLTMTNIRILNAFWTKINTGINLQARFGKNWQYKLVNFRFHLGKK